MKDFEVPVRDAEKVQQATERKSSQIMELLGMKGKLTQSGALPSPCSEDGSESGTLQAYHPWSVYGVPNEELTSAMGRLRERLPKNGWRIIKEGPDGTASKAPQIVADSTDKEFSADIRLSVEPAGSDKTSLIEVTVVSACFRKQK
ncbi:hypothetical protein [Streptomyces corynorhini]|uniref:Uncharacterized protein n=1 Tax=Streptomyces corynorhini TaxID=2282652 RepID=A0A370BFE9_9ACTN|nr:hypothetical protein [Streptomyces corynorhini]RDG38984.1 hypothetical protein DVH02_06465 [Streptomyces corynorhini]